MTDRSPFRAFALRMILVGLASGCRGPGPVADRLRDLADCWTLTVSAGPEASATVHLTDALHLAAGGGVHVEAGLAGGRPGAAGVAVIGLPAAPLLEDGVLHGRYLFTEASGAWRADDVEDECYIVHALDLPPTHPRTHAVRALDVEVGGALLLGARFGFSPGELVDFLLGFVGVDLARDDARSDAGVGAPVRPGHGGAEAI